MTDFFNTIGDLFTCSFKAFKFLGNIPNVLFVIAGFILLWVWLRMQARFNKEAAEKGTLK